MNINLEEQLKKKLPEPKEKKNQMKQLAMKGFISFFILMLLLTLLSRTASSIITPQVKSTTPKGGRIDYNIETRGELVSKDDEKMIVGSGLRVKDIYVEEGNTVEKGEVLLTLDTKEVEEKLQAAKRDLQKLILQREQIELGKDIGEVDDPLLKAQETLTRLEEDKLKLEEDEKIKIKRAEEELIQAQEDLETAKVKLEELKNTSLEDQIEKAKEEVKVAKANLEDQQYEKDKAIKKAEVALQNARENLWLTAGTDATQALQQLEQAQIELEMTRSDWERIVKKAKESLKEKEAKLTKLENGEIDDTLIKQEEEKILQLERQVVSKEKTIEDSKRGEVERLKALDRQLEDAKARIEQEIKQQANESLKDEQEERKDSIQKELLNVDIQAKEQEIANLTTIKNQGGKLVAPSDGVVLEVKVEEDAQTTGGTLLTFVGSEASYMFETEVSKEESEKLQIGDEVSITLDNGTIIRDVEINQMAHVKDTTDGRKKVSVLVDEGAPGMGGKMVIIKSSEQHNTVIPIEALRGTDDNAYVFVAKEKDTSLGQQLVVERIDVMVVEKNHQKVAVKGALNQQDQIIVNSNKPIQAGDSIRLIEK